MAGVLQNPRDGFARLVADRPDGGWSLAAPARGSTPATAGGEGEEKQDSRAKSRGSKHDDLFIN
jgi:hypothetical protein